MERIKIQESSRTPRVLFDGTNGILEIKGRSTPENAADFYKEIIDGIDEYTKDPKDLLEITLDYEFFNTSSSKEILALLNKIKESKCNCKVNWVYEEGDLDMQEAGEDYRDIVKHLDFTFIEKPE